MSRTCRKGCTWKFLVNGHYLSWEEARKVTGQYIPYRGSPGWHMVGVCEPQRDGNPNEITSPPKWFKRQNRQQERYRQNDAVRDGKEMPRYKKRDRYEWW